MRKGEHKIRVNTKFVSYISGPCRTAQPRRGEPYIRSYLVFTRILAP